MPTIKDPTYNIYKKGGNVERKGKEITKKQLKLFAFLPVD